MIGAPHTKVLPVGLACCLLAAALGEGTAVAQAPQSLSQADQSRLLEALDPEKPLKIRLHAALILGRTGGVGVVPALVDCLRDDPDYPVRGACALALGNVGSLKAVEPLMLAMDDPETFVQDEAHKSLKKLARVEALPYLQAARESGTPRVRLALADIVSGLRGPEATTLLAELLGDADDRVRQSAETTLEGLDAQAATELLLLGLAHPNFRVKMRSATLLGRRKEVKAVDRLAELALSPLEATEVKEASRVALRNLRDALDLPALVASARDGSQDQKARARALVLLAAKGGPDALQTCLDLLADPDESMRASAAQALAYLGDPRALAALRAAQSRGENSGIAKLIGGSIQRIERGALATNQ